MDWTKILLEILAVIGSGGLIGTLTAYLLSRRKLLHQEQMDFLPTLQQRMAILEDRHQKCLDEHAKAQADLARLDEKVKEFMERDRFKAQLDRMEMYFHTRTHDLLGAIQTVVNKVTETNLIVTNKGGTCQMADPKAGEARD